MNSARCRHGMDERFCSICSPVKPARAPARQSGDATLDEVLTFLNDEEIRATYGAVAGVLGVAPVGIGQLLGTRRPEASWIVGADTSLPAGYEQSEWHPSLLRRAEFIRTAHELRLRLSLWRAGRQKK